LTVRDDAGSLLGCCPLYIKSHSYGEFVFDQQWAAVCEQHLGVAYYPKLLVAVPFSPCPGPRLLVHANLDDEDRAAMTKLMGRALASISGQSGLSSVHINFNCKSEWAALKSVGYLQRSGLQFHWDNVDASGSNKYKSFDDFLMSLKQQRRKSIRQERKSIAKQGLIVKRLTGDQISPELWRLFYDFYLNTIDRHYSQAYLTEEFFTMLGERMGDRVLLVIAEREPSSITDPSLPPSPSSSASHIVAAALNLIGSDCLYGRNWGCIANGEDEFKNLHFELCYYQALEFAIERGLSRVEAGAQGPHKLQRGYMPSLTYSSHFIHSPMLRSLVERSVEAEGRRVLMEVQALSLEASPYQAEGSRTRLMKRLEEHFQVVQSSEVAGVGVTPTPSNDQASS
jgi:predicted N-acyltransferase